MEVQPHPDSAPRALTLLFVEDNPADYRLCCHELQRAGWEVHADIVSTPEAFLNHLNQKNYDAILADYRLNGWTGLDALRLLGDRKELTPFILLSGLLGDEKAVE